MKRPSIFLAVMVSFLASSVQAHTAWLQPIDDSGANIVGESYQVYFGGHEGSLIGYSAEKVKEIAAVDVAGDDLEVSRTGNDDAVQVFIEGEPAVITMHFDNGIYTRRDTGESVNKPMSEVEGALTAVSAVKYHKNIVRWDNTATEQVFGQPFEVVPLTTTQPVAGEAFKVRVLVDGQPLEGVAVGTGEATNESVTDADGVAEFVPKKGFNKLWAGHRKAVSDNPDYTQLSIEYLLTFEAQ